ncbi:transcriptional repressor [Halobacillus litoralis]|uniref:Transcriptional repressor n=1 Tax=Halobacillus litoralis TaxID=45668 RepID=A0A845EAG8_9BACI|nr:Fur family transcriptional regulator [Halobacillus litoralis]MYL48278.1 transcriptional repressor [Halobacillus litoralis]
MDLQTAIHTLKEKGYKRTKQRERMLKIFIDQHHYLAAKDVIRDIQQYFPGVSYATVYKNLYLLTEEKLLETIEMNREKHFRLARPGHKHLFICKACRETKDIDLCPMELIKNDLEGYVIENHKFEVYGICPQCH